jgi:hypothetical protein
MKDIINGLKLTPSLGVHLSQATALEGCDVHYILTGRRK